VAIGGAIGAVPGAVGLAVYLDPLRRSATGGLNVKVATLDAVPADGVPRKFSVYASRVDAWTKTPEAPVGAVYLRRTGAQQVEAFNVICPHAGCFVDYVPEKTCYLCPCHNSVFALDGKVASADSPAPRGLDQLKCTLQNGAEVWVDFQNYQAGTAVQKPLGA